MLTNGSSDSKDHSLGGSDCVSTSFSSLTHKPPSVRLTTNHNVCCALDLFFNVCVFFLICEVTQ